MAGYRSDINLQIGQMPEIKDDPQVFNAMQEVYNALHILNARLNSLARRGECREEMKPWECFSFENTFWAPAADGITAGMLVKMDEESQVFVPGVNGSTARTGKSRGYASCTAGSEYGDGTGILHEVSGSANGFAIALEDSAGGMVLLGWPPGILEIEGLDVGQYAYAMENEGTIFQNNPDERFFPIGQVVAPDALLIQHGINGPVSEQMEWQLRGNEYCGGAV